MSLVSTQFADPGSVGRSDGGWLGPATDPRLQDLMDAAAKRSEDGHSLYDPSNQYAGLTMQGQSQNPFLTDAYDAHVNWQNDDLRGFIDQLYSGLGGGGGGRGGGGGGGSYSAGSGGGGFTESREFTDKIHDVVDGKYLNEGNPYISALTDSVTDRIRREYMESEIPGINAEFEGLGRSGSGQWRRALVDSGERYADSLGQTIGGLQYQDYNNRMGDVMTALGLGNQFDMNLTNARQADASSARSAAASNYSTSAQRELGILGLLGNAVNTSVGMDADLLAGRRDLAGIMSMDQRNALQMTPQLTGQDIRDRESAMAPYLAMEGFKNDRWITDQNNQRALEQAMIQAQAQKAAARIGSTPANRGLDFDIWRYGQEQPWMELLRYMQVINGASDGYFNDREWGFGNSNMSGNGLGGALGGFATGAGAMDLFGGGGGSGGVQ